MPSMSIASRERVGALEPKRNLFLDLPVELYLEIGDRLPLASKVCLALCCRHLYIVYYGALSSPDVHFPQSFERTNGTRDLQDLFVTERWRLLLSLETRYLQCCSLCMKLHPSGLFSAKELLKSPEERVCKLGKNGGIVDLCPCIRMTFRDKTRMMTRLDRDKSGPRHIKHLDLSPDSPHQLHSCEIKGPQEIVLRHFPCLEKRILKIVTTYRVTFSTGAEQNQGISPHFCCPHINVITYINKARRSELRPNNPDPLPCTPSRMCVECRWCKTEFGDLTYEVNKDSRVLRAEFRITRNFGSDIGIPGADWSHQTVYSRSPSREGSYLDLSIFWGIARFRPEGRRLGTPLSVTSNKFF